VSWRSTVSAAATLGVGDVFSSSAIVIMLPEPLRTPPSAWSSAARNIDPERLPSECPKKPSVAALNDTAAPVRETDAGSWKCESVKSRDSVTTSMAACGPLVRAAMGLFRLKKVRSSSPSRFGSVAGGEPGRTPSKISSTPIDATQCWASTSPTELFSSTTER
jgi:hypothetical protein